MPSTRGLCDVRRYRTDNPAISPSGNWIAEGAFKSKEKCVRDIKEKHGVYFGEAKLAGRRRPRHYDEASVPRTNVACGFPALRSTGWLPARRRAASSRIKFRRR